MKQKLIKGLSILCSTILLCSPVSVFAQEADFNDNNGTMSMEVDLDMTASWTVSIPDSIDINTLNMTGKYEIAVSGNIPGCKFIQVAPSSNTLTFTAEEREDTVTASVVQASKTISGEFLSSDNNNPDKLMGRISVNTKDVPSAKWKGNIEFSVNLLTDAETLNQAGFYDKNGNLIVTWANSGIASGIHLANRAAENLASYPDTYTVVVPVDSSRTDRGYGYLNNLSVTKIILQNGIKTVNSHTNSTNLKYVTIPNTVTAINANAFSGCTAIEELYIPGSVTSIGADAFKGVQHITYNGSATGAPWGALSMN